MASNSSNEQDHKRFLKTRQCHSIILNPTENFEILEAINGLNSHKSSGYVDFPVKFIKSAKLIIASYLSRSFNDCIEKGTYPDELKTVKVVPLHKGGSKTEIGNFRPISILSPTNKIFETLLHKRLTAF